MLAVYRQRRDMVYSALQSHLGHLLDVTLPAAGMHLVGWLPQGVNDQQAALCATRAGIAVAAIAQYRLETLPRGGLLFGYANTHEQAIVLGVEQLAARLARRQQ